jgi:UrcA family protein
MTLQIKSVLGTITMASILVASTLLVSNAQADERADRTTIHLADLSLDRPADVAAMYERINLAAEQVCRQHALNGADVVSRGYGYCVADTVQKVVSNINRAPLTNFSRQYKEVANASVAAR